jgi:5-methylthioadenosine/S-adenosylhomocysteine deaminase
VPSEMLIKAGNVVTVDSELGDLQHGDVLAINGVIEAVGKDLAARGPSTTIIDATGRMVLPGLVDTHRHVWQGAIGAFTPQVTGAGYEPAVLTGIAPKHTAQDVYAGTLWGALKALDV